MKWISSILQSIHGLLLMLLLLIWRPLLLIALLGMALGELSDGLAIFTGDHEASYLWRRIAALIGWPTSKVRLALFMPVQIAVWVVLWRPMRQLQALVGRWILPWIPSPECWRQIPILREALSSLLLLLLLAVVVPLLLQPTLVPLRSDRTTWMERSANLVDGTSLSTIVDASMGLWLRWQARPIPGLYSVTPAQLSDRSLDGALMRRWDPILKEVTQDREHFAKTKAFLWVESAGRQYALSSTGCAGLMQFCVTTARRRPFHSIFGRGRVSACDCGGKPCSLPRSLRDALETDSLALERHPAHFPCNPGDARFDGRKALRAGAAFTTELGEAVGGNLYLMYIGYNSGPAVAKRLWKRIGKNPQADLDDLRPHLAPVLRRWYGARAEGRAQGLLDVHLPKLKRAYLHYR